MSPFKFLVANKYLNKGPRLGDLVSADRRGTQRLFRFPNGFGASVVKHRFSYGGWEGLYELAVIAWESEEMWNIDYTTPITRDVIGYLSLKGVERELENIMRLPCLVKDYKWPY